MLWRFKKKCLGLISLVLIKKKNPIKWKSNTLYIVGLSNEEPLVWQKYPAKQDSNMIFGVTPTIIEVRYFVYIPGPCADTERCRCRYSQYSTISNLAMGSGARQLLPDALSQVKYTYLNVSINQLDWWTRCDHQSTPNRFFGPSVSSQPIRARPPMGWL